MSEVRPEVVRQLRAQTGAGIMDCKNALTQSSGDVEKAIVFLRERGLAAAAKKATRAAAEGIIGSYIHGGGKIGVLIEVNCETDFVAKTPDFQNLVKDLAMQVAAANPRFTTREDVPESVKQAEMEIYRAQAAQSGKPAAVVEKITQGKLEKFFADACLVEQAFIKESERTVGQLITDAIARLGENVVVRRFSRFQVGEQTEAESSAS